MPFRKNVNVQKEVYAMASKDGNSAEITMYGYIYEQQPTDWDGNPIDGQYILLSEFLEDLQQISGCKKITVRMNSYGGDAGVSNTIHNRLRDLARAGAKLTCIVDGVAMSGGSLIMCACDTVKVNPSSLIMIHKCWGFMFGGYNADELREIADEQDEWDKMQAEIYARKTGMSKDEILGLMADTTYMTGREAVEKGFADEVLEDIEPLNIAASADGRTLFVGGRQMHLAPGMFAPDTIPTVTPAAKAAVEANKNQPAKDSGNQEGGQKSMAKTVDELRQESPDLVAQIEEGARSAATKEAGKNAADAERRRIQEIDEIAAQFDPAIVQEAKYGEHPCTAQELAFRAAKEAAAQGGKFLAGLKEDAKASGTGNVGAAPSPNDEGDGCTLEQARVDAKAFNESRKEIR